MRTFLLTIFWISNIGNVSHLLIMASAGWLIISGAYSFSDLSMDVFVTQVAPWLFWVKTILTALFGDFGTWILSLSVFVISPIKFVLGVIVGWWAYSTAKNIPLEPAYN
jgi:hypothetical protein